MASRAIMIIAATLMALGCCVVASPIRTSEDPAGWNDGVQHQWSGMITTEKDALSNERISGLSHLPPIFAQANINAPVESVYAPENPAEILNQPLAQTAMARMKINAVGGDADLKVPDIKEIYASPIAAASSASGIPGDTIATIVYEESKGHPLIANGGLMQIDDIQWGLMKDQNPALTNRYILEDNIMAGALDLKAKCPTTPTTADAWWACYVQYYKG